MEYMKYADVKTEQFLGMVKEGLEQSFPGCMFDICSMVKNNGQKWTGILMQEPGHGTGPILYMEHEYQEFEAGKPFHDTLSGICRRFED